MPDRNWPRELLADINGYIHFTANDKIDPDNLPEDFNGSLDYCLRSFMQPRERDMLLAYYRDGKTYETLAAEYGLTRERIRQIVRMGVRKLYHNRSWLAVGVRGMVGRRVEAVIDKRVEAAIHNYRRSLQNGTAEITTRGGTSVKIRDMRIDEMDISVRAYNCLYRAGIRTVGDIMKMSRTDFERVRNLGRKSATEIVEYLCSLGCEAEHLMPKR